MNRVAIFKLIKYFKNKFMALKLSQQIGPNKSNSKRPNSASMQLGQLESVLKDKPFIIMNVDKNDSAK